MKQGDNDMELTREEIEKLKKLTDGVYHYDLVRSLARLLLAEMDKPKVWDNAPEWAVKSTVSYFGVNGRGNDETDNRYIRELPKSPEQEIAEKWAKYLRNDGFGHGLIDYTKVIESAINEYKALSK